MKKKSTPIRAQLLLMSLLPLAVIAAAMLAAGIAKLRAGMLDEAMGGLLASAKLFREELAKTDMDLTTNELEDSWKAATGYDFTRFEGDTRASTSVVKADGTRPVGTQAAPEVIQAVITGGNDYVDDETEVAGMKYCVAYAPIKDESGAVTGMAFAGKPTAQIEAEIRGGIMVLSAIAGMVFAAAAAATCVVAGRLAKAVKAANEVIGKLAEGEFAKAEGFNGRGDEIGMMIEGANALSDRLRETMKDIKAASEEAAGQSRALTTAAEQIKGTSGGVLQSVEDMSRGASDQADTIQSAAENIGSLSDAIQSVAENAETLAGTAAEMNDASGSSAESLRRLSDNMKTMNEAMRAISDSIDDTSRAVANIGEKVDGITNISGQTNLLALNASIEAARAGEAGRGFAVVAEEIGKLASDSAQMADAIRVVMKELEDTSKSAITKSEEVQRISGEVQGVLDTTVETINGLISGVTRTVEGVDNISGLTEECAADKTIIVDSMASLSAISEQNAASTEETAASMETLDGTVAGLAEAAESLSAIAKRLEEDLGFFKI